MYHLWDLKDYSTFGELSDAIDAIPYDGTGTHTGQAISYARNNTFTVEAGRRAGAPKIAVVITDGKSTKAIIIRHCFSEFATKSKMYPN